MRKTIATAAKKRNKKLRAEHLLAAGFTVWGMFLRLKVLAGRGLGLDEINQMQYTLNPFVPIWQRASTSADLSTFPGEYLLNFFFVKLFYPDKWLTAIPHLIVTLWGFYLLFLICRKYYASAWGYLVCFAVFSLNKPLIYHSLEHRPYAVLPVLALGSFYFLGRILENTPELSSRKKTGIFLFLFMTAIYHVYGMLILALCLLFHLFSLRRQFSWPQLWQRHGRFFRNFLLCALPCWLFFAGSILFVMGRDQDVFKKIVYTFEYIPNPVVDLFGFLKSVLGNLVGRSALYPLLLGLAALVLPGQRQKEQIGFFLTLVVLPLLGLLCLDLFTGWWFIQRHFIWVIPFFAVLLGWNFDALFAWVRRGFRDGPGTTR